MVLEKYSLLVKKFVIIMRSKVKGILRIVFVFNIIWVSLWVWNIKDFYLRFILVEKVDLRMMIRDLIFIIFIE